MVDMDRWSTKDADEELALRVIRLALDVPVVVHDDRAGRSTYDLEIQYRDGRRGAAEVVSTRDRDRTALERAVGKRGYVQSEELTRLWMVNVVPGTVIRRIEPETFSLLVQLEKAGIDRLTRADRHPLTRTATGLGIVSCWSAMPTSKHPPGFYIWPDASAAWVGDGDGVRRFCEEFLADENQADVLAKLNQEALDERHAVVILSVDQLGHHTAIDTGALPTVPPLLPPEVDWLWVIASKSPPVCAVYWGPYGPWLRSG